MKTKRILSMILCALMLAGMFVSCDFATSDDDTAKSTTQTDTVAESEETTAEEYFVVPAVQDFEGYTFRVMTDTVDVLGISVIHSDEMTGEAVNDAIYSRDRDVEEKYNIKIEFIKKAANSLRTSVKSGDDICDIALPFTVDIFTLAQEKYIMDFNTVQSINMDNPWWDQRIKNDLEVKGKVFCMAGDYTIRNPMTEFVMQYNKQIYDDYGFENPYKMVTDGKWTTEIFWSMAKQVSKDLNGDGAMDAYDCWGYITEVSAPYYFFIGSGNKSLEMTEDGYRLTIGDEKTISALEKSLFFATDTQNALCVDDKKFKPVSVSDVWKEAHHMFISNQGLFRSSALGDVIAYRDMKIDYGVLPIPKASEEQEEYYCLVSSWDNPIVIPVTIKDSNRTGLIIEALFYASHFELKSALYDVLLSGKLMRDEESIKMLELITNSKTYDLDWTLDFSGIFGITSTVASTKQDNLTSSIAKIQDKAQAKLDKFLNSFDD